MDLEPGSKAGSSRAERVVRIAKFCEIIAHGGRRSDCIKHGMEQWGVSESTCDHLMMEARKELKKDWDIERPQMIADLLSQCATLQQEARERGQLNIALGAINTAARLAHICS